MIKAILSLRHGVVLPHFNRLPDRLSDVETGLFVPQAVRRGPTVMITHQRVAVSSFGMSGTNTCMPKRGKKAPASRAPESSPGGAGGRGQLCSCPRPATHCARQPAN